MGEHDHPFDEIVEMAERLIRQGDTLFQKFTCGQCHARQTMDKPNVFYTTGRCEECGYVTDIQRDGCNYMLIRRLTDPYQSRLN